MATVYPDNDEIKFRYENYRNIEDILNDKVECTICNNDLLNEIISKKMIMVHSSHLFLCCYNCFYKLCEDQEYSCISCKSNKELSNCEKCNLNVCKRCVKNHKITQVSSGIITKCFNCEPQTLWKQRAQAANVLKIFSSQLDLPNGLLVNEVEREQNIRKYLINEAKIGQNSTTEKVRNRLCLDFILNTYKCVLTEKLSDLFPKTNYNPFDKCLSEFIENCEYILEKTCSTLTNFKKIFNLNSSLNPGVTAIIKTLLKSVDEDDCMSSSSRNNKGDVSKVMKNNTINEMSTICKKKSVSKIKQNKKDSILNSTVCSVNNESSINLEPTVLLERIDDSILFKKMNINSTKNVLPDAEKDETLHPLDLFDDLSSISSDTGYSRTLRNRKVLTKKKKMNNITKGKPLPVEKSDDEKENDRLTNFYTINHGLKKKNGTEVNLIDLNNSSTSVTNKSSKQIENKIEAMQQAINNVDDTDSDADIYNGNDDYSQKSLKDIFLVQNSLLIPQNYSSVNSSESDDSSINDVINSCLIDCRKQNIDHYRKKNQENQLDINAIEINGGSNKLQNEENMELSEFSDKNDEIVTANRSNNISPFRMPSLSDDSDFDLKVKKKMSSKKRKLVTSSSSNESDSSSKYFKKTPKKLTKSKNICVDLTFSSNNNSNSDSDSEYSPIITKKHKRIRKICDESSEENNEEYGNNMTTTPTKGRKNIRKMKNEDELSELTKDALQEEKSRKMRLEKRQQLYNQIFDPPTPIESCKKLVLDFDSETKEELITVHPDLVKFLKPHQVAGVKFLWDSVFESLDFTKKKKKGSGAILAHCMGLGKTLQIITLVHTLFRYPEIGIKTVLIITPHSTIENWCKEFHKWLSDIPEKNFFVLNFSESKTYESRKNLVQEWQLKSGVLVTSYQSFRTVVQFKGIDKFPTLLEALVDPGPDLIICDEGHLLKNHNSAISKAVNRIKTLRRIVLTGTPLQNNLKEYHCMVDFIRPNLLGSLKDFTNRFINPITNGQYSDSTPMDVKLMKRRSHVLHRMLQGFVQRCDYTVLTPFLPPKQEYVIYLKMSSKQIELYKYYLDKYRQTELFANYHMLQMIWTHPKLLAIYSKQVEKKKQKLKDMESTTSDNTSDVDSHSNSIEEIENVDHNWWKDLVTKKDLESVYPYSKFIMMFSLLQECEEIGDKVLIFSQSLNTLDLIQHFLENAEFISNDMGGPYGKSWYQGEDFFRIDGSVTLKDREECCEQFNDVTNLKMRLLLLSTKAFNLGVNLVAANRVIIFDVTWNPTLNVQSIFRVFRFGQTKPCYIYRFVSEGTMEQKIYERQISKLSMAFRVIDEHQIDRHFNAKNQEELYEFEPITTPRTTNLPKDRLMAELILKHKDLVIDILEHDSLLQNNEAEELDENDRNAAWDDYEKERSGLNRAESFVLNINHGGLTDNLKNMLSSRMQTSPEDVTLFNTLRTVFPKASMVQLNDMLIQVKRSQAEQ